MLNEKEKRIFWIVVMATAVVSLITAVIGGWLSWMMNLIEGSNYNEISEKETLDIVMQALLFAMGTVSVFLFFFNKSRRNLANFIMFGCEMGLTFAISVYWFYISSSRGGAFLALGLAISISAMFVALASLFLAKNKAKAEEKQQQETETQE